MENQLLSGAERQERNSRDQEAEIIEMDNY